MINNRRPFIAMEMMEGKTLKHTISYGIVRIDNLSGKGWITLGQTKIPQIWLYPQN